MCNKQSNRTKLVTKNVTHSKKNVYNVSFIYHAFYVHNLKYLPNSLTFLFRKVRNSIYRTGLMSSFQEDCN